MPKEALEHELKGTKRNAINNEAVSYLKLQINASLDLHGPNTEKAGEIDHSSPENINPYLEQIQPMVFYMDKMAELYDF